MSVILVGLTASQMDVDAIVVRHDRSSDAFVALAAKYPPSVNLRRAGRPRGAEGTLVAPRWILTAAHVASGLKTGDIAEAAGQVRRIREVVTHPDWKGDETVSADIALVYLEEPITAFPPVALYKGSDEAGQVVTFVGRGGTGTGLTGPDGEDGQLRAATNRVEDATGPLLRFRFDGPDDRGVTDLEGISGPGDSGGPGYLEQDGRVYVAGVSSSQDSRPAGRRPGRYGVLEFYPRVSHYAGWIESVLASKR